MRRCAGASWTVKWISEFWHLANKTVYHTITPHVWRRVPLCCVLFDQYSSWLVHWYCAVIIVAVVITSIRADPRKERRMLVRWRHGVTRHNIIRYCIQWDSNMTGTWVWWHSFGKIWIRQRQFVFITFALSCKYSYIITIPLITQFIMCRIKCTLLSWS